MLLNKHRKTIICKGCGERKPVSEFYCQVTKYGKVYASTLCKECKKARVRELYYSEPKNIRRARREKKKENTQRTEAQPEFYEVRDCVVYARLMYYDIVQGRWVNRFHPIIKMPTEMDCYQFLSIARDLSTGDLKRMAKRFLQKYGTEGNVEK